MMNQPRAFWIVVVLLFLIIGTWLCVQGPLRNPEPTYQGKTVTEWILLYDNHVDNQAAQRAAQEALLHFKEKALPTAVRLLRERDPKSLRLVKNLALRLHLFSAPQFPLYERHLRAGRACAFLGFNARVDVSAAVPELAYNLTNTVNYQSEFAYDLAHAGPTGIAVLTNALSHPSRLVREEAVLKLLIYPKDTTPNVINAVLAMTRDIDYRVRVGALLSLHGPQRFRSPFGPTNAIVEAAIQCCHDTNAEVRKWAVDLLGGYPAVPSVKTVLTNLLEDPAPNVRTHVQQVLQRLER